MSKLDATIADLKRIRENLHTQLAKVEAAIAKAEDLNRELANLGPEAAAAIEAELESTPRKDTAGTRVRNQIPPRKIAELARDVILSAGKPLKRSTIVELLEVQGVHLAGKDKNKNLGTILWRHPEMFVTLDNLGYWPKDAPLPGVYDPD